MVELNRENGDNIHEYILNIPKIVKKCSERGDRLDSKEGFTANLNLTDKEKTFAHSLIMQKIIRNEIDEAISMINITTTPNPWRPNPTFYKYIRYFINNYSFSSNKARINCLIGALDISKVMITTIEDEVISSSGEDKALLIRQTMHLLLSTYFNTPSRNESKDAKTQYNKAIQNIIHNYYDSLNDIKNSSREPR